MSVVLVVLGLSFLIAIHEAGHLVLARLLGMRVEVYSIGFGRRLFGFRRGDTDYRVSLLPLGGYCKIAGFTPDEPAAQDPGDQGAFLNRSAWRRLLVIAAGPGVNYALGFLLIVSLFATLGYPDPKTARIQVVPGGPAAQAGLQTGDEIESVDAVPVHSLQEVARELQRGGSGSRTLSIRRAGALFAAQVQPRGGRIEVSQDPGAVERLPLAAAVRRAGELVWLQTLGTAQLLGGLFRGRGAGGISGPVGIVSQASSIARQGLGQLLVVLSSISIGLGAFNLLPIPALDGGRLVFLGWEVLTRRRPNQKAEAMATQVGALLLIALVLVVTVVSDLPRFFHHR